MLLYELIHNYNFDDIKDTFIELYPEFSNEGHNLKGIEKAMIEIKKIKKPSISDINGKLYVTYNDGPDPDDKYYDVFYQENNDDIRYSMMYRLWDDWIKIPIDQDTINNYDEILVLCHILWEMTWNGYTQEQVQQARDEFLKVDDNEKEFDRLISMVDDMSSEEFRELIEDSRKKIEILNQLDYSSDIEQNNGWIDVNKKLPENNDKVLARLKVVHDPNVLRIEIMHYDPDYGTKIYYVQ